jgi:hypothetical protein
MFAGLLALLIGILRSWKQLGSIAHQRARQADCEASWQRPSVAELAAVINDFVCTPARPSRGDLDLRYDDHHKIAAISLRGEEKSVARAAS